MGAWLTLLAAGLFETVWAVALKKSNGLQEPVPTVIFVIAAILSFYLLSLALKSFPVSMGYAVFTGIGAVGAALVGMTVLAEPASITRILPIGLIAVGIVWLALVQ